MKIIVLEGIDGSGKSTLAKRLEEYLQSKHVKAKYVHFPNADFDTGKHIYSWLNNEFGKSFHSVNFAAQHMMYALDRYEWFLLHGEEYKNYVLICDRYTTSSMIYQAVSMYFWIMMKRIRDGAEFEELEDISFEEAYKLALTGGHSQADYFHLNKSMKIITDNYGFGSPRSNESVGTPTGYLCIRNFVDYIMQFEYITLDIPVPDLILYVKSDAKIASQHMQDKNKDAFESDIDYMEKVSEAADYLAQKFYWKWVDNTNTLDDAYKVIRTTVDEQLKLTVDYLE